jgi:hypothetical protein
VSEEVASRLGMRAAEGMSWLVHPHDCVAMRVIYSGPDLAITLP